MVSNHLLLFICSESILSVYIIILLDKGLISTSGMVGSKG